MTKQCAKIAEEETAALIKRLRDSGRSLSAKYRTVLVKPDGRVFVDGQCGPIKAYRDSARSPANKG